MKLLSIICLIGISIDISSSQNVNYRLNDDIEPINYKITLTPYLENKTFDGMVDIDLITMKTGITEIVLHKKDLNITRQQLITKATIANLFAPSALSIIGNHVDPITDKYTIKLTTALEPNQTYTLTFDYTGKLRTDMLGFYLSSYVEGDTTKLLASTQMEPVHARSVFPCFDEPRFKATFEIIIYRPKTYQPSISNAPILTTTYESRLDLTRDEFEKTPKMSTYLVAFIVSEFKCRENGDKNFTVCSRPPAYDQTEYSLEIGQKTLAKFDEVFDYPYNTQMKKMHMIAVPDFDAGAMENWGLLTYRETALLYQQNVSTSIAQQRVAAVVAHEQTHMWFGDLVTCDWWSHTWLNEGFARFFQYFGLAMVEDKWGLDQQFVVEQLQSAFDPDSLENSLPLSYDVNSPEEIADRFGSISYNKGASVIRMVEHTLGHNTFIAGLRKYLKDNELKTAVPKHLYDALQSVAGEENKINVTSFMGSWVTQAGYPVLSVSINDAKDSITVKQTRFLRNYGVDGNGDQTLWHIPITYATNKNNADFESTSTTAFITDRETTIEVPKDVDWVVFNVQQSGYYRVNYDDNLWSAIDKVLHESHETIHVLNRAQIVDDALSLARASHLEYKKALKTVGYLKDELDYVPWLSAFNNFDYILARFNNDESHIFKNFVLDLVKNVYNHLSFQPNQNDTRLDAYNRVNVLNHACQFGHEQCIKDAQEEYNKLKTDTSYSVPADLRPVVYCSVITQGNEEDWKFFWEKLKAENVAAETVVILNALGCTKSSNLTTNYLNLILTPDVRLQDKHAAFVSTLKQSENLELVLDFVIQNHKNITEIFETATEVPSLLSSIATRATTSAQIDKISQFSDSNELGSNKVLQTALNSANFNLKWASVNVPEIKSFLNNDAVTSSVSFILLLGVALVAYFNH